MSYRRLATSTVMVLAGLLGIGSLLTPSTSAARGGGKQVCGGILEIPCPEGYVCVYDPTCSDCTGTCKRQR